MTRVAVIGSGFVGRAWAISFARAGCEVALWDQDKDAPRKALAYIERLLPDLEASDLLNGATASAVAAQIHATTSFESALEGAVHVQENTPEDVEVKRAVFARLRAALQDLNAGGLKLDTLSMGMSGDFESAIAEGATLVRIGTALFGSR